MNLKRKFGISTSLAWQSYDVLDLCFVTDIETGKVYNFEGSGRFIFELILSGNSLNLIIEKCLDKYDGLEKDIKDSLNEFINYLLEENIIYEN